MDSVSLEGKTVVVTGANSGIGKETARDLARRGARVILACRDQEKATDTMKELTEDTGNENIVVGKLDLASLSSVRRFAEEFNNTESRLDILINNAGLFTMDRRETEDGFELHMGTNHLGHFLLTNLLLPKLEASAPSRIVIVSSEAHKNKKIDLDDLQYTRKFDKFSAYGRSKTANVLHAVELARRLKGTGVTVYSLHPGVIRTNIFREGGCCMQCFIKYCLACCMRCFCYKLLTLEEGARTTLYCALEPSIADHSGKYYSDEKEKGAEPHATDPETARRLWELSEELVNQKFEH